MVKQMIKFNLVLSLFAALFVTYPVQANVTWSFNTGNCLTDCSNINSEASGNVHQFKPSSNSVTVSAFSTTKDQSGRDAFETAKLRLYTGGLGITNNDSDGGSPRHAIDNNGDTPSNDDGDVDAVQFSFNQNTSLDGVEIGWKYNDSDITVLAHDGVGDKSLLNKTFAQLLENGWNFIGHYSDLITDQTEAINSGDYFSSDWLITAYTPEAGSPNSWSFGNDYFKLSELTGKVSLPGSGSVPEPSSILLLLLAMIGWKISKDGLYRFDSNLKLIKNSDVSDRV